MYECVNESVKYWSVGGVNVIVSLIVCYFECECEYQYEYECESGTM